MHICIYKTQLNHLSNDIYTASKVLYIVTKCHTRKYLFDKVVQHVYQTTMKITMQFGRKLNEP